MRRAEGDGGAATRGGGDDEAGGGAETGGGGVLGSRARSRTTISFRSAAFPTSIVIVQGERPGAVARTVWVPGSTGASRPHDGRASGASSRVTARPGMAAAAGDT